MTRGEEGTLIGHVVEIRRYPVKSMQGEQLDRASLEPTGLEGDRRFAVIDAETGRVASAKNPRKWAGLLELAANFRDGVLEITPPNSGGWRSDRDDLHAELSKYLGRAVRLRDTPLSSAEIEIQWPDVPGLANAGAESTEVLPAGGFFDLGPLHLLTTATVRRLRECAPNCNFDLRRFRPNLVIETRPEFSGFVEAGWVGRTVGLGNATLQVTAPCSRCIMTTLPQPGLPPDPNILRAAVAHSDAAVGVYAAASRSGSVAIGDRVWLS